MCFRKAVESFFSVFFIYLCNCLLLEGTEERYSHIGVMSPKLCDQHLAVYPATESKYSALEPYWHLIPYLDGGSIYSNECSECPSCNQIILLKNLKESVLEVYRCPLCKDVVASKKWLRCRGPCLNSGYFQDCNNLYFHFFMHFLQYCTENSECSCYWPEHQGQAALINQYAVSLVEYLSGNHLLHEDFSPYWNEEFSDENIYKIAVGSLRAKSLATYSFFYSQHRQVCLDLAKYVDGVEASKPIYISRGLDRIYQALEKICKKYLNLYSRCILKHPHPKIYYERGMVHMQMGNQEEALKDIRKLIELGNSEAYRNQNILTSEMYRQEGEIYTELGMYDKAIEALNQAILKDPTNFDAYFQRASAYFEIGDFDHSLEDYLISKNSGHFTSHKVCSVEFMSAFTDAAAKGSWEAACDFVPSLCYTVYGLGSCLWTFGEHPVDSVSNLAAAGHEMAEQVISYLKTVDRETLDGYANELVRLYDDYSKLSDKERGELVGHIVGKYGVEIFAGGALLKGVSAYNKLKEANRICNMESMLLSSTSKDKIAAKAVQQCAERRKFFENCKVDWDKQNKHIPGTKNYDMKKCRSDLQHPDPSLLLKKHGGTGLRKMGSFGEPGYKEVVDFKEYIGIWKSEDGLLQAPTTRGTIHYSKNGAHIVPAKPN